MKRSQALVSLLAYLRGKKSQTEWARLIHIDRSLVSKAEKGLLPSEEVINRWIEKGLKNLEQEREQERQDANRFNAMMQVVEQFNEIGV